MSLEINVSRRFADFDLKVDQTFYGEGITALFGASGCGKSTLLRIIAGLETKANGTVSFGAHQWQLPAAFTPPWLRGIGFVFQEPRLFPHLSVAGNLAYAEKRSANIKSEITRQKVVAALDLAPLLDRQVAALSGGEKQRVAIGRALLTKPSLLLMDEPLSALDLKRRAAILPLIRSLPAEFGLPVIYVTHAIDEVAQIADRIALMKDGQILAEGPIENILENPEFDDLTGRFEAGVVLDAVVENHDTGLQLTVLIIGRHKLSMPLLKVNIGETVRLRIRARDVSIATERPHGLSVRNIVPVNIISIDSNPDSAFAELVLAFGEKKLRARITRASVNELQLIQDMSVFALIKSIAFDRRGLAASV